MLLDLLFAALAAAAAFAVFAPFLRKQAAQRGSAFALYRAQLAELNRAAEAGPLDAETETLRREVARRLLAEDKAGAARPAAENRRRMLLLGGGAAFAVPALAFGLYLTFGRPDLPGAPMASRDMEAALRSAGLDQVAEHLFQKLMADPAHPEGWALLAGAYMRLERYDEAAAAYARAIETGGAEAKAAWFAGLGEALTLANGGTVTPQAKLAFDEAVKREPDLVEARYYLAVAMEQAGDADGARAAFQKLLDEAPADAPYRPMLEARLNPDAPVPGLAEDPRIQAMVESLAARLQAEPRDLEGWLLLMTSYVRLGAQDKARAALAEAQAVFKDEPESLAALAAKAAELGL